MSVQNIPRNIRKTTDCGSYENHFIILNVETYVKGLIMKKVACREPYYSVRQIRIPPELYREIKLYCHRNLFDMKTFYQDMLIWFRKYHERESITTYYACYKGGKILSIWFNQHDIDYIKYLAKSANVSDARIVYTALILYTESIQF